jgi:hypothetical protein
MQDTLRISQPALGERRTSQTGPPILLCVQPQGFREVVSAAHYVFGVGRFSYEWKKVPSTFSSTGFTLRPGNRPRPVTYRPVTDREYLNFLDLNSKN